MSHDAVPSNGPNTALLRLVATSSLAALVAVVVRHVVRRKLFGARGDGFPSALHAREWMSRAAASSTMRNERIVLHIPRGRGREGVLLAVLCGDSDQEVAVTTVGVAKSNLQRGLQRGHQGGPQAGPRAGPPRGHDGHGHVRESFSNSFLRLYSLHTFSCFLLLEFSHVYDQALRAGMGVCMCILSILNPVIFSEAEFNPRKFHNTDRGRRQHGERTTRLAGYCYTRPRTHYRVTHC